jgi:hypothetical protein
MSMDLFAEEVCRQLNRQEISAAEFILRVTRSVANHLRCSRAGLWTFQGDTPGPGLRCRGLYDRRADRMKLAADESGVQSAAYLEILTSGGHVVADDVQSHPATAGLFDGSAKARRVRSLMAVCFSVNGVPHGVFACTQLDSPMRWSPAQQIHLKRICAKTGLALAVAARAEPLSLAADAASAQAVSPSVCEA